MRHIHRRGFIILSLGGIAAVSAVPARSESFIAERSYGTMLRMFWHAVAFLRAILYARTEVVRPGTGWQFGSFVDMARLS
jgi:hypothetical protein